MTVCCRSNDLFWGLFGSNHVHFSILMEYVAASVGVHVGQYTHLSNNYHIYQNILDKLPPGFGSEPDPYLSKAVHATPIVTVPEVFDYDLALFFEEDPPYSRQFSNQFFPQIAIPLKQAYAAWRAKNRSTALGMVRALPEKCDWRVATEQWMLRRMKGQADV